MYPFRQVQMIREERATLERLIDRSQVALQRSNEVLALPRPDVFLGRRNLIEPPPIEYE